VAVRICSIVGLYEVLDKVVKVCWSLPLGPDEFDAIYSK
jgi:hypothetical protein